MSKHLQRDLEALKRDLLTMGAMVEEALRDATAALRERRAELAREVIEADNRMDRWEVEVEEECLKVLALHQPVAADLRFIAAVMKINNDLERMGDLAVNVAERAAFLATVPPIPVPPELDTMTEAVLRMVRESLDAFVNRDAQAARRILGEDREVDQWNRAVIETLVRTMKSDPSTIEAATHVFSVSRYLERIGDHATNVAEDVVYLVEGEIIRHGGRSLGRPVRSPQSIDRSAPTAPK